MLSKPCSLREGLTGRGVGGLLLCSALLLLAAWPLLGTPAPGIHRSWQLGAPGLRLEQEAWLHYPDAPPAPQTCIHLAANFSSWIRHQAESVYQHNYARYVDKVAVKYHVRRTAPGLRVPATLAVFTHATLHALPIFPFPKSFAFKAAHGSGMNILVIDGQWKGKPLNVTDLYLAAETWLATCYMCDWEAQYQHVRPAVIVEELVGGGQASVYLHYTLQRESLLVVAGHYNSSLAGLEWR